MLHVKNPMQSQDWAMYVFFLRDPQKTQEPHTDSGEKIVTQLVSFDKLLDLVDSGELYRFEQSLRLKMIRAKYLTPAVGLNKIKGQPFKVSEIEAGVEQVLKGVH